MNVLISNLMMVNLSYPNECKGTQIGSSGTPFYFLCTFPNQITVSLTKLR